MTEADPRFDSIQGLLSPRGGSKRSMSRRKETPQQESAVGEQAPPRLAAVGSVAVDDVGPAAQLPKLAPRRDTRAGERSGPPAIDRGSAAKGGTRRVAIRLPEQLHSALVDRVDRDGSSKGHVVLDAIEYVHSQGLLAEVIVRSSPVGDRAGGLFDRTRVRGRAEPSVPAELGLRASALEQLDRLAAEHGAESRTQLVTAALAAYLTGETAGILSGGVGERSVAAAASAD